MSSLAKKLKTLAAVMGFAAAGMATVAQAAPLCGVSGIAGGNASPVLYDPFNPSGLASTTVTMAISRINPPGGGKTAELNFYLKSSSNPPEEANGIQIIPRTVSGQGSMAGVGLNVFKNYPVNPEPDMTIGTPPTSGNAFVALKYNGNPGQADVLNVTFDVIMPPNLNLNASRTLTFEAVFTCKLQGGAYNNVQDGGSTPNAMSFPVTVLSALRTYFAGTALDFGEIGLITESDYATKTTGNNNYVYVQSSGAYDVTLSSQNGFILKKPNGGNTVNDQVKYSLSFLGETVSGATFGPNQTAISKNCIRAGLASESKQLPIKATLLEPGAGKNPSNLYQDILTVTLAPKAYGEEGVTSCGV